MTFGARSGSKTISRIAGAAAPHPLPVQALRWLADVAAELVTKQLPVGPTELVQLAAKRSYSDMTATFSKTARSERHFSALLLPHLLMSNNFAGCRALFEELELCEGDVFDPDHVEIVAELNPVRDVLREQGQVVPDLFLRIGDSALVIEAKFFTHPSAAAVADQLKAQREAIKRVLPRTHYADCKFRYLALTVRPLADFSDGDNDMTCMTWSEIISVLEPVVDADGGLDTTYALEDLKDAVTRSCKESDPSSKRWERMESIEDLLREAPALLARGYRYIGFSGGKQALADATVEDMEKRSHYKYSDCKPNENWIPLYKVISHYLKLKAEV